MAMVLAAVIIWRQEGHRESGDCLSGDQQKSAGCLYDIDVWGTCSNSMHPIWLLAYRIVAFSTLLALLLADLVISGAGKFYFYTEWTFTLVTIYFGLAFTLSVRGSMRCRHEVELDRDDCTSPNAEHGSYVPPPPRLGQSADMSSPTGSSICYGEPNSKTTASIWGYVLQIIFQYRCLLALWCSLILCFG